MSQNEDDENPWAKKKKESANESKKPSKKKVDKDHNADDFLSQIKEKLDISSSEKIKNVFSNNLDKKGNDDSLLNKFFSNNGGNTPQMPPVSKNMLTLLSVLALGIWFASGIYVVQEGDTSVVLRFGKLARVTGPGLSYRLPWPIEGNIIRKTASVNQIDGVVKTEKGEDEKTLVLTGDENMIHVNYSVFWRIKDLPNFLFTNRTPEETIKIASESSIREVLGQTTARLALTSERENIGPQAREVLQKILDLYQMGVEIVNFQLQMVEPPSQVIDAFNDMQASLIDANKLENDAQAYANSIIPNARGQAVSIVQEAKAYHETQLGKAKGDALRFDSIYHSYKSNKEIALQRFYLEGMQRILSNIKNKTFLSDSIGQSILPHVSLNTKRHDKKEQKGK
ncbi:MAG: FtsH protease activity modulator HflK [Proteobacteria bacterium]|nr:FtsH protease activity modulator HflK [Pseudomonadota bacterium]